MNIFSFFWDYVPLLCLGTKFRIGELRELCAILKVMSEGHTVFCNVQSQ